MKLDKLAIIIAVLMTVVASVGCDETAMVDDIIINGLTQEAAEPIRFAELKQTEDETAAAPTNSNREKILSFPNPGDEGFDEWYELVLANAVNVNVLDITGCTPNPLVIEVGYGEVIEIKNSNPKISHTLSCRGNSITIPAGGSRGVVVSEFAKLKVVEDGTAGYTCRYTDHAGTDKLSGIFRINSKLTVKPHEKQKFISDNPTIKPTTLSPGGYEVVECGDFTDPFMQVEPIGCDGQRITGHRMLDNLDQWNQETVAIEFYTDQPTPKPLFGFMPKAVVNGNVDIVDMFCVYWRDEVEVNLKSALVGNRNGLLELYRSSHIDLEPDDRLVMVYRPYSAVRGQDGQHSVREMNLHLALVDYLNQAFKVKLFNLYGGSADGVVAMAVAQHRPERVATVGLSAPSLSINTWEGYNEVGPTPPSHYDPWDYVENLPPDLPIFTVYDLKDKVVPNEGILPFFEKVDKQLNLPLVKLVLIDSDDQINHHGDMVQLFEILTRPENKDFHPAR